MSGKDITVMNGVLVLTRMVSGRVSGRFMTIMEILKSISFYQGDEREGEWKYYDENGKLEKVEHYEKGNSSKMKNQNNLHISNIQDIQNLPKPF